MIIICLFLHCTLGFKVKKCYAYNWFILRDTEKYITQPSISEGGLGKEAKK